MRRVYYALLGGMLASSPSYCEPTNVVQEKVVKEDMGRRVFGFYIAYVGGIEDCGKTPYEAWNLIQKAREKQPILNIWIKKLELEDILNQKKNPFPETVEKKVGKK